MIVDASKANRSAPALTRRDFAMSLAAAAASGVPTATAQEPKPAQPKAASSAAALADVAQDRYGKHLTEEQLKEVRRGIERGLRSAERLRQVKLANGDEPAFVFSALLS
jgi:hypothetical protein